MLICVTYSLVDQVLHFWIEYTMGSDFSLNRKNLFIVKTICIYYKDYDEILF